MKSKEEYQNEINMEIGSQLNNPIFTGKVYGNPMVEGKDVKCTLITFETGCINSYHIHHGSEQTIICVGGRGCYQEEGKEAVEMRPGDSKLFWKMHMDKTEFEVEYYNSYIQF